MLDAPAATPPASDSAAVTAQPVAPVTSAPAPATPAAPTGNVVSATPDELVKIIGEYQVKLTRPKCIGAASCVAISPDVFALDEKMLVEFVNSENPSSAELLLAAQSCPTAAIEITEVKTGQKLWPLG